MSISTIAPDVRLSDGDLDNDDGLKHIARKEDIMLSAVEGVPVTTLCGRKMLQRRNPDNLSACEECLSLVRLLD